MIYIVSVSYHYCPCSGVYDWKWITKDLDKAKHRAQAEAGDYCCASVIRLNPDTLYYDIIHQVDDSKEVSYSEANRS